MPLARLGTRVPPIFRVSRPTRGVAPAPLAPQPVSTGADPIPTLASRNDSLIEEALRFADRRTRLARQFALEIATHPDLDEVPSAVQDFLLRTWPLVIAHTRLTIPSNDDDPGGQIAAIDELIWSVRREATMRQPVRLFELLPGLLQRLRDGLALLGQDCRAHDRFFRILEALHRPVLRMPQARRRNGALPSVPPPVAPASPADSIATRSASQLAVGCRADLYTGDTWRRVRLAWVASHGGQYMFAGEHGRMHTMTRRILDRLLAERLLVLVEQVPRTN